MKKMTIDERLEKLVERHEALTRTVESLAHDMNRLRGLMDDAMLAIARLAHLVDIHERPKK